jgi:hypothetical protein
MNSFLVASETGSHVSGGYVSQLPCAAFLPQDGKREVKVNREEKRSSIPHSHIKT